MENGRIIRTVGAVGFFTALSRILGLARDVLMAGLFGTGVYMSAFVVAFTIPNLFRRLFGEGALSSAFVPVFVETRNREGDARAWALARRMFTLMAAGLGLIAALVMLGLFIAGRFTFEHPMSAQVVSLLKIMFPYMWFICLAALAMAVLHSYHRFNLPAAAPCVLNIIWIGIAAGLCPIWAGRPELQIHAVAWGILAAGFLQLAMQFPMLSRLGFRPGLDIHWKDRKVLRVFGLMGPAALGLAVTQVNVLIDRLLAAWIGPWAPAALYFSERLIYLPLGLFATAMATVLLPVLSGFAAREDHQGFAETVTSSLRQVLFVMIPAAAGLLALSAPITQMVFEWKAFGAASTEQTALALSFYAPGLLVFSLAKVLVPAFYARQDTRTPVKLSLITLAINVVLNITFVLTWPQEMKHAGLALATVIAEAFYGGSLLRNLHRKLGSLPLSPLLRACIPMACSTTLMIAAVWYTHDQMSVRLAFLPSKIGQLTSVTTAIIGGIAMYFLASWLLGCRELKEIRQSIKFRNNM